MENAPRREEDRFDVRLARARTALVVALRRRGISHERAEDLAQEACVRAIEARTTFDDERPMLPWLIVIALRLGIDQARRAAAAPTPDTALPPARPEEAAIAREQRARLESALADLSPLAREVVDRFHRRDESIDAIATRFGVAANTVKSWLHRARRELAGRLR